MSELVFPEERTCQRCGRHDVWDETTSNWVIADRDDASQVGDPFCLHEWDINGTHNPVEEESA